MKEKDVEKMIADYKEMIAEVKKDGMIEWAKFYETKLETMITMAKFDGKLK